MDGYYRSFSYTHSDHIILIIIVMRKSLPLVPNKTEYPPS